MGIRGDTMVHADLVRQGDAQLAMCLPNVRSQELFRTLHEDAREPRRGVMGQSPIGDTRHAHGVLCQPSGRAARLRLVEGAIVLGRTYLVQYTDGRGQAQTERGRLVALDQEGFVVLEVNGKHVLIPKARIDALVEVE